MLVLTKAEPAERNTGYAQGGIAAAIGDDDSPALHAADTMRAGDGSAPRTPLATTSAAIADTCGAAIDVPTYLLVIPKKAGRRSRSTW